jgi:hypothetical protein
VRYMHLHIICEVRKWMKPTFSEKCTENEYQMGIVQRGFGFICEANGFNLFFGDPTNVRN